MYVCMLPYTTTNNHQQQKSGQRQALLRPELLWRGQARRPKQPKLHSLALGLS